MSDTEDLQGLYQQWEESRQRWLTKHEELAAYVAKQYGLGQYSALNAEQRKKIDDEVDEMVENHNEALVDAEPEEWRALDERLASNVVGRLLQELHELSDHMMYLEDQRDGLVDEDDDE
jgi:hypothetical protein